MKGWFDAFRHDGGPTLYDRANRTAVTGDVSTITFCVIFITLFVAFLIILPGIRKEVSQLDCIILKVCIFVIGRQVRQTHENSERISSASIATNDLVKTFTGRAAIIRRVTE